MRKSERSDSRPRSVWGRRFPVCLMGQDQSFTIVNFEALERDNPGTFSEEDVSRLRQGESIERLGVAIAMTGDHLCTLCGKPVGKGALKCHECEHRDEGPGYHVE